MSQKTNLNINPYYDDFDRDKNFYKVLFKPGFPVQSRELTTLQSILQNQVEDFGSHIFKEGSMVVPGNISYDGQFYSVKVNSTQFGVDLSVYIDNFVGKTIIGQISGTTAKIQKVVLPDESDDVEYITLYVKYLDSDDNFEFTQFQDGEPLSANESIVYGNTTITAGTSFASLISSNATSIGSACFIGSGVYFIRGYFVKVNKQNIILDYYTNTPSYRVGLKVTESIINAKEDNSLYDNAKGFTNYAAPGSDRLKIDLTLTKKLLSDTDDTDFVELLRVKSGKVQVITTKTEYNQIRDYLAERTFDESGDYTVRPFGISLSNSLNNRLGNDGIFLSNELTSQRNIPSDDLACLKISPGKAYVRGYDIEKISTEIIDIDKSRDTEETSNLTVPFEMGNILNVNNAVGLAKIRETIDLYSQFGASGTKIGEARVYSFNLTDSKYSGGSTIWDLRLYDIQTYTRLTLNQSVSSSDIKESFFIKGNSSGASGFATADGSSSTIFLRQTSGTFVNGEGLTVNGIDISRSIKEVRVYNTQNIKSVKQTSPFGGSDFTANSVLERFGFPGGISQISVTAESAGTSTITSTGRQFVGIRTDSIVRYQQSGSSAETYNRVSSVSSDLTSIQVTEIPSSVSGVFDGSLPSSNIQVNGFLGAPIVKGSGTLYARLPESNTSSVNLSSANLYINEQLTEKNVDGSNQIQLDSSAEFSDVGTVSWATFDQERYGIGYSGGNIAPISDDAFNISGNTLTIKGLNNSLSNNDTVVNVTGIKSGIKSKVKNFTRSTVLQVTGSKLVESGSDANNSKNDGLTYNQYYGLRVQDEEISLNYPDVVKVLSIYESLNTNDPTFDQIKFSTSANVSSNALIGENIIGNSSGAVARVVTNSSTTPSSAANTLGIVYLNDRKFSLGEAVFFEESNINTTVELIQNGSYKDVTSSFSLNRGQKNQYYDYSRIVRNKNVQEPSRKIFVVFDHYTVPSDDTGDVFTVESYDVERFATDIPNINGRIRASDTLDFRPRVSTFDPSVTTDRSPFDFNARTSTFNTVPSRILASGEGSIISQGYYLPRIDKIYLDTSGKFIVEKGVSSKTPKPPVKNSQLLELGTLTLPPYLYSPKDATLLLTDNRRYTMRDIGFIEDRVENLEVSTSLSLLELGTQSLQIKDSEGLDRFKTGFFVDDFSDGLRFNQFLSSVIVDTNSKNLIPNISRNSLESLVGTSDPLSPEQIDFTENFSLLDPSIQKTGNVLTLAYDEIDWLEQPFATAVENVNPFNIVVYTGSIQLNPQVDNWTRTVQLEDKTIKNTTSQDVNLTNNLNQELRIDLRSRENITAAVPRRARGGLANAIEDIASFSDRNSRTFNTSSTSSASFDTVSTSIKNEIVGVSDEEFMRSRNTEFRVSNLKSNTRFYQFLDGNSSVDVVPKLIEIANSNTLGSYGSVGSFSVGETVIGYVGGKELIKFRVCTPNHKSGSFSNPSVTYNQNPYFKTEQLENSYSPTTKVLNVDTFALSESAQGLYFGYIEKGMQLVGQSSSAIAYVKDIRLISDNYGDLIGAFFLKDPYSTPLPTVRIPTGTKTYRITSSKNNETGLPGSNSVSFAESNYTANATVIQFQATVTETTTTTNINNQINLTTDVNASIKRIVEVEYTDPLAQTFTVGGNIQVKSDINTEDDVNGVFLTSVDLFFASIDSGTAEVRVEVRSTLLGTPTQEVIGKPVFLKPRSVDPLNGLEIELIETSDTGEIPTNVKFPEPIFLAPGKEYAIVIISDKSDEYELWTAVMGENTVNTQSLPDVDSVRYSKQFALGSLFKSQNGSIWSTNQYQDLKFKLYKAQFTQSTGTAFFYNPPLDESNGYVPTLINNPITILPKTGRIGIDTTTNSTLISDLSSGRKLSGVNGNNGSAIVVGQGSSVSNASELTVAGENYPASVTNEIVDTFNFVGKGTGLKLLITTNSNGVITGVAHSTTNYGNGYQVGDVVGIVTSSTTTQTGRDARVTITSISGLDTLYLTNVQGEFGVSKEFAVGAAVSYYNDSGTIVSIAGTNITSVTADGGVNSGNYIKVNHFNHGMYSTTNKLSLNNIESSEPSTTLSNTLSSSETTTISVEDSSNFSTFEGVSVSGSYPGYIKIGSEIIKYSAVGSGTLTIGSNGRGVDNTVTINHDVNSVVQKYEFGGVSLRRINNVISTISSPIEMDDYHIEIDRSTNGPDRSSDSGTYPQLSFDDLRQLGGNNVTASQNIIYNSIIPTYDVLTPGSLTSVNASIRTISGTSVDGTETSFLDNGYETVQLNTLNTFNTVRVVCSEENQNEYLASLPSKKSITTAIVFNSQDSNLSPILNLDTAFSEFYINRLNSPITDYISDSRVNSVLDDPHSSVYYSNLINLSNPASTLKVILSAERPASSDFRVLYSLIKADSSEINQSFDLFPGYDNLTQTTDGFIVVDDSKNSGLPDRRVPASVSGQFLEYEFTAENLDLFTGFVIKIVMSGTNQAATPRIGDLRTIAIR
jgi:hypothetical protein